jgi:hypothetical protein
MAERIKQALATLGPDHDVPWLGARDGDRLVDDV